MCKFTIILFIPFFLWSCQAGNTQKNTHEYTNALSNESSPYLLQHAHNPVNWYPWGEEALAKAKAEDKLLIISVGYAACHWCHVMEKESFEDTTVARIMNENFIAVKVDREERPDVDDIYMSACQLASGDNCGWPLNAFALPDGRPIFAGTYLPKKEWLNLLEYFIKIAQNDRTKLEAYATQLTTGVQALDDLPIAESQLDLSATELTELTATFLATIDVEKGGRSGVPKFPMPNNYEYLLKYHYQMDNQAALEAVLVTLNNMAKGGIYDHLGGGFARYSTDENWHIPHFEKMLYDNGQLVSLYAKAYQLTKDDLYKQVIIETLEFIERELTSEEGGFYSSLDADSEGEEGKFYVWSKAVTDSILGTERISKIFNDYYEVSSKGNWEGTNILHRKKSVEKITSAYNLTQDELSQIINDGTSRLFQARSKRTRPNLDDKLLTSWNALMLSGYVDAYKALGEEKYLAKAEKNAEFISKKMLQSDARLDRTHKDGHSTINAFLDDYANTIQAFIDLYEVTFKEEWLYKAKDLLEYAVLNFSDENQVMFFYTSSLDDPLIARKMELADNVIPASNSTMARNLYRLGLYLYNDDYTERAALMLSSILPVINDSGTPSFYSNWLQLYLNFLQPPFEVAIVGENYSTLQKVITTNYLPNAILLGGEEEGSLELLKNKLQEGETLIYVCQDKVCKFPVRKVSEALKLMQ